MALKKIGALWIKDGKNGKFMSGVLEQGEDKTNILVFKNTHHEDGDKKPQYEIFVAEDDERAPF